MTEDKPRTAKPEDSAPSSRATSTAETQEKKDNANVVCHYTTADALLSTLKNKTLWLSMHQFMNDPIEMVGVDQAILSCHSTLLDRGEIGEGEDDLDRAIGRTIAGYLEKHHRELSDWPSGYDHFFIFSCSCTHDSLSLWQRYAPEGGFGLLFYRQELEKQVRKSLHSKVHKSLVSTYCHRVEYYRFTSDLFLKLKKRVKNVHDQLRDLNRNPSRHAADDGEEAVLRVLRELSPLRTRYKHETFADESEYRFVVRLDHRVLGHDVIKFRNRNGIFIPYIELSLPDLYEAVYNVVISPILPKQNVAEGLLLFLKELGLPLEPFSSRLLYDDK